MLTTCYTSTSASLPLALDLLPHLCSKWTLIAPAPLVKHAPALTGSYKCKDCNCTSWKRNCCSCCLVGCALGLYAKEHWRSATPVLDVRANLLIVNRATCSNLHFFFHSTLTHMCHILFSMKYMKDNNNC